MAGFASRDPSVRQTLRHFVAERSLVRIFVATGAGAVFEAILHEVLLVSTRGDRMALRARHCQVRAGKRKAAFLVQSNRIRRRLESLHDVAAFALTVVGRLGELPTMHVLVAVGAFRELNLVARLFSRRYVALVARHGRMPANQRICRERMLLHAEKRRLPSVHGVTSCAFALVLALGELPVVFILVAVHAPRKCDRLLEICIRMTLNAIDLSVLPEQRKLRLRVVEPLILGDLLPAGNRVARFAGLRKGAMMRIAVAVAALREGNARESWLAAGSGGCVALLASNLRVKPGERKMRLVVVKFLRRLPVHEVVALQAVLPQLAFVRVLMARDAILRQSQKRPVQIPHFDLRALRFAHVRRRVTLIAGYFAVFPLQRVAGLIVIERFERRQPVNQRKILAIMLGMALRAFFLVGKVRMKPAA